MRVDTSLVGFENLKWLRGNISYMFYPDGQGVFPKPPLAPLADYHARARTDPRRPLAQSCHDPSASAPSPNPNPTRCRAPALSRAPRARSHAHSPYPYPNRA